MLTADNSFQAALPFGTRRQAALFLALVLLALSLPVLVECFFTRKPADVYKTVPPRYLNYRFIGDELANGDAADIVFIGASDAWTSFDAKTIGAELSRRLGRPVRVLNFGTNWPGAETNYQRVRDLLSKTKVRVLVLAEGNWAPGDEYPHRLAKFLLPVPDAQIISRLTARQSAKLYATAMLGAPHRLWSELRHVAERPILADWQEQADRFRSTLGFLGERQGWKSDKSGDSAEPLPYVDRDLAVPAYPVQDFFFRGVPDGLFRIQGPLDDYQSAFRKLINEAVKQQGGIFAVAAPPIFFDDNLEETVKLHALPNDVPRSWPAFGISMTRLFPGQTFDEVKRYYSNENHLGSSGATAFSKAIVPALYQLLLEATPR